jgi:hypothetical protein
MEGKERGAHSMHDMSMRVGRHTHRSMTVLRGLRELML